MSVSACRRESRMSRGSPRGLLFYGHLNKFTVTVTVTVTAKSSVTVTRHHGIYNCIKATWLQLGVRAALRSFLVDLFVPKIKLRVRERVYLQGLSGPSLLSITERTHYSHFHNDWFFLAKKENIDGGTQLCRKILNRCNSVTGSNVEFFFQAKKKNNHHEISK